MGSASIKNPEQEAEHPAPMPESQQGQGGQKNGQQNGDQGGQQGGQQGSEHKAKMAVHSNSPPGIELDGKAHIIPVEQRTKNDQEKAKQAK